MTTKQHPEWLVEPCPAWCDGEHADQLFEADRRHHSERRLVPVIQRQEPSSLGDSAESDELNIVVVKDVGSCETWVVIANDRQSIEVTLESAGRLLRELDGLLAAINSPDRR